MDNLLTPQEIEEAQKTVMEKGLRQTYGLTLPQHLAGLEWQAKITAEAFVQAYKEKIEKLAEPEKLREAIADCFRIARQEGVLTRYADGKSDADDVIDMLAPTINLKDKEIERLKGTVTAYELAQQESVMMLEKQKQIAIQQAKQEERNRISKFLNDGGDGMGGWCVGNASCKNTPNSKVDCVKCWQEALKGDKE
jgi:signal transduction histidine kinase